MSDVTERRPQFSIEAEQVVLGAMMLTDSVIADIERVLGNGSGFYRDIHATIYRAILALRDNGEPTGPIAVAGKLAARGDLQRVGGAPYLHTCFQACPVADTGAYYAGIVAGYAALRGLGKTAARIAHVAATAGYEDAGGAVEQAREWLADVDVGAPKDTLRLWGDTVDAVLDEIEKAGGGDDLALGLPTGIHDLDSLLGGGLRPGQLILVAARPGVGKSVLLTNIAQHAAMQLKLRTALFSLEMSEVEVGLRIASAGTGVPLHLMRTGKLSDEEWTRLARFAAETADAPLHTDPTARATLAHIRAGANRLIHQYGGLDLILVDYLQLMETHGSRESREQQVAALSRGLKLLGKELGLPVVAASQLNRNSEHRSDKRPSLSDLRESGSLEQDSDIVLLLHRDDVHDHESPRAGECDIIVAKNRQGPLDTVTVAAQLHLSRFKSMAIV